MRYFFSLVDNIRGSYFRGLILNREIRENKNPAKITTYTVSGAISGFSQDLLSVHLSPQPNPSRAPYPTTPQDSQLPRSKSDIYKNLNCITHTVK